MIKLGLAALTAVMVMAFAPVAQTDDEVIIERWDVTIGVQNNAALAIREEQVIAFGEGGFSRGSRSLSIRQFEGLTDVSILVDGEELTNAETEEAGTYFWQVRGPIVTINWFFDETSNTTRTFTILYTVVGAIEFDAGISNRLLWDAIPVDHRRPINASQITVVVPSEGQLDLTTPPVTYGAEAEVTVVDDFIVTFDIGRIDVGQGVRVETYFTLPDEFAMADPIELPGGDPNSVIGPRALIALEIAVFVATFTAIYVVWQRRKKA